MKHDDYAEQIRRLARFYASETLDEDSPVPWEHARRRPYGISDGQRTQDGWTGPSSDDADRLIVFHVAERILGDQACGEIYRAELARVRAAQPIDWHCSHGGAVQCGPQLGAYSCAFCGLVCCMRCDTLVVSDEIKTAVRWCLQPACQRDRASAHGAALPEKMPP